MNITRIKLDGNDPRLDPKPGAWGNLNNTGCGLPGCKCSPGYWISLRTNEGDLIKITMTKGEADAIKRGEAFDLRGDGQDATSWVRILHGECVGCGEEADWSKADAYYCNSCASEFGAPDAYPQAVEGRMGYR